MPRLIILIFLAGFAGIINAQNYKISMDLTQVKKDRIKVTVLTPPIAGDTAEYVIPTVIPGSYSQKDFGRFISGFKAYSDKGRKLKVKKDGNNVFVITGARSLSKIEYMVDDTWDAPDDNYIFQPGGTNIDAGRNFMINHHGFFGYIEGLKMLPYEITVTKPERFYGSTALRAERGVTQDVLYADNYVSLVDNPVMYNIPDTTSFLAGNTRVYTSVFSESGAITAKSIEEMLSPLADALNSFFNGMPVDQYHFIFYFTGPDDKVLTRYGGFGALEHSYSSVYFLPEIGNHERLKSIVNSVSAHEFLHILTPLNIHSEEIEYFDFRNPKMSAHLWLYEGVTEYFSHLVQLRAGLITQEEFNQEMASKVETASEYKEVSFTDMSRNILSKEYKEMYNNVYYKGALIAWLLDIRINEISDGKTGLKDVLMILSEKYGPSRPFKDDELIDEIVRMTGPEIETFFTRHVQGSTPLPLRKDLEKIGLVYYPVKSDSILTYGVFSLRLDEKTGDLLVFAAPEKQNIFGFMENDVIVSVNGIRINQATIEHAVIPFINITPEVVTVRYRRGGDTFESKVKALVMPVERNHIIEINEDAPEKAVRLRNALLK